MLASHSTAQKLQPKEIAKRFADYLIGRSYCVDVSCFPPKALHISSNTDALIESFRYDFPAWACKSKLRVDADNYAGFLASLTDRLISLLPRVNGVSFKPVPQVIFESRGLPWANTYVPFTPSAPSSFQMPEILEEYLGRVFMNDQDRKYVTQWMADIIQNPSRRPQWAVVLTGTQGTGKSSIYRLVSAALGYRHTWEHNEYTPAFQKFSEVLPDNLLVCFDDATSNKDIYQTLKQAITRPSMKVEVKGQQKLVEREIYARILICSNSTRPLRIEEGDRRLYCAQYSGHRNNDPDDTARFFVKFNEWFDRPDTPATVYHWLSEIDLSDFIHGSTIKTDTHSEMVGLSSSVLDTLLADFVEGDPIFHNNSLLNYLKDNSVKLPDPDSIKLKMDKLGYHSARRLVDGCNNGKQIYVWQKKATRSRPITEKESKEIRHAYTPSF